MLKFKKAKPHPPRIFKKKSSGAKKALARLNGFINSNDKKLVKFVIRLWKDQENAITYKDIREAILRGYMTEEQFKEWQEDYAVFVNTVMKDILEKATTSGATDTVPSLLAGIEYYKPMNVGIDNWITVHGAEWITNMSDEAKEAVSTLIRYTTSGNMSVDELARAIRPTIGLNTKQAEANLRFYETRKEYLTEKYPDLKKKEVERRARDSAARYAARQHRERAQMIAETELAYAYNKGADDAIQQAQEGGLLPKMKSVWSTAADEGVCGICSALDGVAVDYGDDFEFKGKSLYDGQKRTPPAHPRCRCAICYEEAE